MTVYVDAAIHPRRGRLWCHMFSLDLAELHAFARRLGRRRDLFQEPPKSDWPHYDLDADARARAVRMGAAEADRCTVLEVAWTLQGVMTPEKAAMLKRRRAGGTASPAARGRLL